MTYKVFLVEDEIVIREGIRDHVDWTAHGFEFCGEAPDGEMALPLLQAARPDILITDIRMPFMDGLQLSQIVRDRMPATRIIILSGHDEFEYAQKAIKLGVSEYLLKPVSVQDLHSALQRVASELELESSQQQALQALRDQVEENRAALRERFLLRLVTGAASSAEAVEKSQLFGIDLIARCYLVVVIRVAVCDCSEQVYQFKCQGVTKIVSSHVENNPDVFLINKDMEELVLVFKGNSVEYLNEEREMFLERIGHEVAETDCRLIVGSGTPQKRITDISLSFAEATVNLQKLNNRHRSETSHEFDGTELLKVDRSAVDDYLRSGTVEDFAIFFEAFIRPLGATALQSAVVKNHIITDIVLAAARFVDELGGSVDQIIPELADLETLVTGIETVEELQAQARDALVGALVFRDRRVHNHYDDVIKQAQDYIERHYMDAAMSLNGVAAQVNLSPSYFSAVFSQETGQTFKEYLTEIRIKRAKELLRTTPMRSFEICYAVGYNDPHYFSQVFRKNTGLTPMEFRLQIPPG